MATTTTTTPRFHFPTSPSNLDDLLTKFHLLLSKLKTNHDEEMFVLQKKVADLESENRRLRAGQENHSIFNIDYVSTESKELEKAKKHIDVLNKELNDQCGRFEEMKSKYNLQRLMNENQHTTTTGSENEKIKDLESRLEQVKVQVNQFDQCQMESDEQIRVLKDLLFHDRSPINPSHPVKQSDLFQQTNIVENLLQKQQEKILNKLEELLDPNPRLFTSTTNAHVRKGKKKRL